MKLFGVCCLVVLTASALSQSVRSQVSGKWIYNVSTLKLNFNAATKARIKKEGPDAAMRIEQMKQALIKQLSGMAATFRPDGRFVVGMTGSSTQLYGKWSVTGRKIKVVMDDKSQKSPQLELLPGGKTIRASFNQPSFGSGSVNLIKRS